MNKKLLVIGCSFSVFKQQEGNLTWPKILSEKIDWHIYNSGMHGNSLQNQIYQLDYYLKNYHFDFIIFQATTSARDSFIIDERKYIGQLNNFVQQSENYFTNFFPWIQPINCIYNMTTPWIPNTDFEKKIHKLHLDNLAYHISHYEPLFIGLLYEIYRRLQESKIPYIYYCQIPFFAATGQNREINFPHLDFCYQQEVGQEKFDSFRIDEGHHISDEGNYFLVDNYIYPLLKRHL